MKLFVREKKKGYLSLEGEGGNTGQVLALQELQGSSTTSGNMGDLVNSVPLGSSGGGISTSDDRDGAVGGGSDDGIEGGLGALGKGVELKDTGGAVPEDGLCASNNLGKDLVGLLTAVESQPAVGDAGLVGGIASFGGCREAICGDVIDGEVELDVLGLGGLDQLANNLGTILVKERVTDLNVRKYGIETCQSVSQSVGERPNSRGRDFLVSSLLSLRPCLCVSVLSERG